MQEAASVEGREPRRTALIKENVHRSRCNAVQVAREQGLPMSMVDDLEGYGNLGLIQAADSFNFERGLQFGTYAEYRIRGAIRDGLKIWRRGQQLATRIRSESSEPEGSPQAIDTFIERMSQVVVATTHDRLASDAGLLSNEEEPTPEDHAARAEQVEILTELLQEMDPHRREVLQLSYVADLRTVDIGAKLNMHKSSVTKLRTRTLASLRKQFDVADVNQEAEDEDDAG